MTDSPTAGPRVRPVGDTGWLLDLAPSGEPMADCDRVLALAAAVRESAAGRLAVDVVPAATTVLVTTSPERHADLGRALTGVAPPPAVRATTRPVGEVVLPVHFDGEDLATTAELCGTDPDGLVRAVTTVVWRVAFGGFVPGFGYLVGGGLSVPRLESPRTRVPPGSVGLAGPYAGVYPRASPGGWRLVGRLTPDAPPLFDPAREQPAPLVPGCRVRFRDARGDAA